MEGAGAVSGLSTLTAARAGKSLCRNLVTIPALSTDMGTIYVAAFRIPPAGGVAMLNKLKATKIGEVNEKILAQLSIVVST